VVRALLPAALPALLGLYSLLELSFPGICALLARTARSRQASPHPVFQAPSIPTRVRATRQPVVLTANARHRTTVIRTVYLACLPPVHTVLLPQVWVLLWAALPDCNTLGARLRLRPVLRAGTAQPQA